MITRDYNAVNATAEQLHEYDEAYGRYNRPYVGKSYRGKGVSFVIDAVEWAAGIIYAHGCNGPVDLSFERFNEVDRTGSTYYELSEYDDRDDFYYYLIENPAASTYQLVDAYDRIYGLGNRPIVGKEYQVDEGCSFVVDSVDYHNRMIYAHNSLVDDMRMSFCEFNDTDEWGNHLIVPVQ